MGYEAAPSTLILFVIKENLCSDCLIYIELINFAYYVVKIVPFYNVVFKYYRHLTFLKELGHIMYTCLNVYYISLDTYGKYLLNMSVFIMYEDNVLHVCFIL